MIRAGVRPVSAVFPLSPTRPRALLFAGFQGYFNRKQLLLRVVGEFCDFIFGLFAVTLTSQQANLDLF